MKIALLGSDPELPPLAAAAIRMGHTIVQAVDTGANATDIAKIAPYAEQHTTWESLLDPAAVAAIFVGRASRQTEERRRTEQLRHLANEGSALLLIHPVVPSMLMHHELAMIARDTGGILFPFIPADGHPVFAHLLRAFADDTADGGADGNADVRAIETVTIERSLEDRSREAVVSAFARDAYLLRTLFPNINILSAVGVDEAAESFVGLTVHLTGPDTPAIRWTVAPASVGATRLEMRASRRHVNLQLPDTGSWSLRVAMDTEKTPHVEEFAEHDSYDAAVRRFAESFASRDDASVAWRRAVQSMDLVDAIEVSLEKGRAVEVQMQDDTEQVAFRARMTTFGCRFFLFLPLFLIAIGLLSAALGVPVAKFWPTALLAFLILFLLLQLAPRWLSAGGGAPSMTDDAVAEFDD